MQRTKKSDRQKNARQFYQTLKDGYATRAVVVVEKRDPTSNSNLSRTRFWAVTGNTIGSPDIIAESSILGKEGCWAEFTEAVLGKKAPMGYYDNGFKEWLSKNLGLRITYDDGFAYILEK